MNYRIRSRVIIVGTKRRLFFFKMCILIYLKTIKKDLHSKQEHLEALNKRVNQSLNERRNASVRSVAEGVRRLNVQKTQIITLLSEKEEQLKYALNRWVDFQKIYTEIKNINDWFEQREETLNRYQRIVTQREFEIALEDVKVRICTILFEGHYQEFSPSLFFIGTFSIN